MNRAGPRPEMWVSGPNPRDHLIYRAWSQQRNQAKFRGEPWTITFEQYRDLWGDRFEQRGRDSDQLCMTRRDVTGAWSVENVQIMSRAEHNRVEMRLRMMRRHIAELT